MSNMGSVGRKIEKKEMMGSLTTMRGCAAMGVLEEEAKYGPAMVADNPLGLRVGKISSPVLNVMLQLIQAINQTGIFEILL